MPKRLCDCKHVINLSGIPSENEWRFVSEVSFDKSYEGLSHDEMYSRLGRMAHCASCARIHIFDRNNRIVATYRLERGTPLRDIDSERGPR